MKGGFKGQAQQGPGQTEGPAQQGPGQTKAPDFIIIGAAKCGTTSLHHILAQHERVFIPDYEVYFFDVDDVEQHPDFFRQGERWIWHDFDRDHKRYLQWYRGVFAQAEPGQVIGEDTTTYLASRNAAARIERMLPEVKLIAMLRDPVARAYSHYWHNVHRGRAGASFEHTLRHSAGNLLLRGRYLEQLRRYGNFIQRGSLKVVFFEDFVRDMQTEVEGVCHYLGIDPPDLSTIDTHQNVSPRPLNIPARLAFNRMFGRLLPQARRIPNMPGYTKPRPSKVGGGLLRSDGGSDLRASLEVARRALLPNRKPPPMQQQTREFLQKLFARENAGLSELLGQDVAARWPYMAGAS